MTWPEAAVRITVILVVGILLVSLITEIGRRR
jgi:hypothetical protein